MKSRFPYQIWTRRRIEVNTDPQRRCYWGAHAKSEMIWQPWNFLYSLPTREEAEKCVTSWLRINPHDFEAEIREEPNHTNHLGSECFNQGEN